MQKGGSLAALRVVSPCLGAIRLHRLVREVAAARREGESRDRSRRALVAALAAVYPNDGFDNPISWSRCVTVATSPWKL